jgi:isopenicillin-N N-acyltransferase-like protein
VYAAAVIVHVNVHGSSVAGPAGARNLATPPLRLRGAAYQQGLQLGRAAADLIARNIRDHQAARDARPLDRAEYAARTRANEAWVARAFPELLDELEGIADSTGLEYLDLLDLNVNTDVAYARASAGPRVPALDCTQVLASGAATADGRTYLGKTRDLSRGPSRHVLVRREYDDGTGRAELQIAGLLTLPIGLNQHGLALTTSGQWSPRVASDPRRGETAWHILNLQPLLRHASSVDEVIDQVREQPRLVGLNLMAADRRRAVALEVTDRAVHVHEPAGGVLVRTNHYLSAELAHLAPSRAENPGTFQRFQRATALARARHGRLGREDVWGILRDHATPPVESICRHATPRNSARTCSATVMCPQDGRLSASLGAPCEQPVVEA